MAFHGHPRYTGDIDVFVRPSRVDAQLDGLRVNFIGKDQLIANERAANEPKDLSDLDKLDRSLE